MAVSKGLRASFMTRPFGVKGVGNGGHFNFSLWHRPSCAKDGRRTELNISGSEEGKHFLAGILAHGAALEAICSPTPPCYTRHGNWAPTTSNWGIDSRFCAVRVRPDWECMELRMPSASANVYLVMAAVISAGMDGINNKMELPPQRQDDAHLKLPVSLEGALQALEKDEYMVEKMGKDFVRWYTQVKRAEIAFIDAKMEGVSEDEHDLKLSEAWQHLYMEFL